MARRKEDNITDDIVGVIPRSGPYTEEPVHGVILNEAFELLNKSRNVDYGDSVKCFEKIAALWSAYLDKDLTPQDVCSMMALMKIGRECQVHKHDNLVDAAGYIALASDMVNHQEVR